MNSAADMARHSGRATPSLHDAPYRHFEETTGRRSTYPLPIPVQTNPATSDVGVDISVSADIAAQWEQEGGSARNLLVSHWPVRDDVAARLTVDTIKRQAADPKLSRAKAFQQAMRAIRNDVTHDSAIDTWAHPNAWAPFSLIGDGAD